MNAHAHSSGSAAQAARFDIVERGEDLTVAVSGDWTYRTIGAVDDRLRRLAQPRGMARLDLRALDRVDTGGALVLHRTAEQLATGGRPAEVAGASDRARALLALVARPIEPLATRPRRSQLRELLARFGSECSAFAGDCRTLLGELGLVALAFGRALRHPRALRASALSTHIERAGIEALPIVGMLTLLIGAVLAQQASMQLAGFGAEVMTVDMIGVMFLREAGVLLAAIIVAGRSGAAFAAQIGTMKVSQQVDAMSAMGIDPVEVLVLPRVLALVIVLPLLTLVADVMGLAGGGLAMWVLHDVSPHVYVARLHDAVGGWTFAVAMFKAPVMAAVIALVGCSSGMRVRGGAESVGRMTTSAVVKSIFAVIALDAVFAMVFAAIGV